MALLDNGSVMAWGGTLHKKLGKADEEAVFYEDEVLRDTDLMPNIVKNLYRKKIVDIVCGDFHSVAL